MLKAGILGGGQLGRMLLQAAINYPVETFVMENDPHCPAAHLCHHFIHGDIRNYDDVYNFGKHLDAITIEIESVNIDALEKLQSEGVSIYPNPSALRIIKNKILQKEYYKNLNIPTSAFVVTQTLQDVLKQNSFLPAVHKVAEGGYDGRGVQVISNADEIHKGFDSPSVLEKMVDIDKEIAQIIAINKKGEIAFYPPVDMVFDPNLNLLDYQVSPAYIPEKTKWKIEAISLAVVKGLHSPGIFAVELFIDTMGDVFVNETAPRVHNSGHHTIEANFSSQFDMLWRIILDYPLGNPAPIFPAAIVNLLGEKKHTGQAIYEGLDQVLKMDNVFVHLYGKRETRPGRKMGHVTIMSRDRQDLAFEANKVKHILKVISKNTSGE
ncbi:MAG: 5-(carboxyamino)imidazole ribonucleotide synthase [Flavitalea sp.]